MSFDNFFSSLGKIAAITVVAMAEAQSEQTGRSKAYAAEDREAAKWEQRKQEALANIEDGLSRDSGTKWMDGLTSKQKLAIELRAEVTKNCRDRSEAMMSYTEDRITSFQRSSW